MTTEISLNTLRPGEKGRIRELHLQQDMNQRLQDMGFTKGSRVECVYKAPFGDPSAYFIKGTLIAVRAAEAEKIIAEYEGGEINGTW